MSQTEAALCQMKSMQAEAVGQMQSTQATAGGAAWANAGGARWRRNSSSGMAPCHIHLVCIVAGASLHASKTATTTTHAHRLGHPTAHFNVGQYRRKIKEGDSIQVGGCVR